jgi:alanine dehydrogenase
VQIESNAGREAGYTDKDYAKSGARIVDTYTVWNQSNIVVKVRAPMYNNSLGGHEAEALEKCFLLISYIYHAENKELVEKLQRKPNLKVLYIYFKNEWEIIKYP